MLHRRMPKVVALAGATLLTAGLLVPVAGHAKPPAHAGADKAHDKAPHKAQGGDGYEAQTDGLRPAERDLVVDIVRASLGLDGRQAAQGGLPPGLAQRGTLPPGLQRKLEGKFPRHSFKFSDDGLVVRDRQTGAIIDIIKNVLILGGTLD